MKTILNFVKADDRKAFSKAARSESSEWLVHTIQEQLKEAHTASQAATEEVSQLTKENWALSQAYQIGYRKALTELDKHLEKLIEPIG